jgi:hypothetical protein
VLGFGAKLLNISQTLFKLALVQVDKVDKPTAT